MGEGFEGDVVVVVVGAACGGVRVGVVEKRQRLSNFFLQFFHDAGGFAEMIHCSCQCCSGGFGSSADDEDGVGEDFFGSEKFAGFGGAEEEAYDVLFEGFGVGRFG